MHLLGKVNDADAFDIDVARVVEHIRVINPAATEQLTMSPAPTGAHLARRPTTGTSPGSSRMPDDRN
jgi:hypothetical protein